MAAVGWLLSVSALSPGILALNGQPNLLTYPSVMFLLEDFYRISSITLAPQPFSISKADSSKKSIILYLAPGDAKSQNSTYNIQRNQ